MTRLADEEVAILREKHARVGPLCIGDLGNHWAIYSMSYRDSGDSEDQMESVVAVLDALPRLLAEREEMRREVEQLEKDVGFWKNESHSSDVQGSLMQEERDTARARVATLEAALREALAVCWSFKGALDLTPLEGDALKRVEDEITRVIALSKGALEGKAGTP